MQSPAVHCAATAAALCESVLLIGLTLFEETAALALPRVRSVGRAAAERAGSLAVQVQSAFDEAQAAVDGKRCSAWLRAALKVRPKQPLRRGKAALTPRAPVHGDGGREG